MMGGRRRRIGVGESSFILKIIIEDPIAFAALFISLIILTVGIIEVRTTRKHHELSVRPHLKPEFRFAKTINPLIGLYLVNAGIGPGEITEFIIKTDNGFEGDGSPLRLNKLIRHLGFTPPRFILTLSTVPPKEVIKVDEERPVIVLDTNQNNTEVENEFILTMTRLSIKVKYKDSYGNPFESDWLNGSELLQELI